MAGVASFAPERSEGANDALQESCFLFCSFVNNLALASNILLADMKSMSCKMLTLRLVELMLNGDVWLL